MSKVRVKQIGEMYYPQYKSWFIWKNLCHMVGYDAYETIRFGTLEEATEYAKDLIITVHKVNL